MKLAASPHLHEITGGGESTDVPMFCGDGGCPHIGGGSILPPPWELPGVSGFDLYPPFALSHGTSLVVQGARVYGGPLDWRDRWHRTPVHWAAAWRQLSFGVGSRGWVLEKKMDRIHGHQLEFSSGLGNPGFIGQVQNWVRLSTVCRFVPQTNRSLSGRKKRTSKLKGHRTSIPPAPVQ